MKFAHFNKRLLNFCILTLKNILIGGGGLHWLCYTLARMCTAQFSSVSHGICFVSLKLSPAMVFDRA
jgi:hypothetical protein